MRSQRQFMVAPLGVISARQCGRKGYCLAALASQQKDIADVRDSSEDGEETCRMNGMARWKIAKVTPEIKASPDLFMTHGFQKKEQLHYFTPAMEASHHRASYEGIRGQLGELCRVACLTILSGCGSGRRGSNVKHAQGYLH